MGCILKCHDICREKYRKKESKEKEKFDKMKVGLKDSLNNVSNTMDNFEEWDRLLEPVEEKGL